MAMYIPALTKLSFGTSWEGGSKCPALTYETGTPSWCSWQGVSCTKGDTDKLIPYDVNTPLWSDGAVKRRWIAVPNDGPPYTTNETIGFAATGEWTFPRGTVLVKHFDLPVDDRDSSITRRIETRLLVRDTNGAVYGVTYKWRADNSDADLLTASLNEDIPITNAAGGTRIQTYYYPSPQDCLTCPLKETFLRR